MGNQTSWPIPKLYLLLTTLAAMVVQQTQKSSQFFSFSSAQDINALEGVYMLYEFYNCNDFYNLNELGYCIKLKGSNDSKFSSRRIFS